MPAREAWGLDIGQTAIHAVKLRRGKGVAAEVADLFFRPLETGLDDPEYDEKVAEALREFVRSKQVTGTPVAVALPGFTTLFREFPLPAVGKGRLDELVSYEAKQHIPFPLDEVIWDYHKLREDEETGELAMALLCCRRDIVEGMLSILDEAKLEVDLLQVAPVALGNYILHDAQPEGAVLVLDTGARGTDFAILKDGAFWLRSIGISGTDLTKALMAKFSIPFEKAESLKLEMGDSKQADRVFKVVEPALRNLCAEVQRSMGYYKANNRGVQIGEAVLVGNTYLLAGVDQFVADNINLGTRTMAVPQTLPSGRGVDAGELEENRQVFGTAAGLALQAIGLAQINISLLPRERRLKKVMVAKQKWVGGAVACLALASAVSFLSSGDRSEKYLPLVEQSQGARASKDAQMTKYKATIDQFPAEKAKIDALASHGSSRGYTLDAFAGLMEQIERWNEAPSRKAEAEKEMRAQYADELREAESDPDFEASLEKADDDVRREELKKNLQLQVQRRIATRTNRIERAYVDDLRFAVLRARGVPDSQSKEMRYYVEGWEEEADKAAKELEKSKAPAAPGAGAPGMPPGMMPPGGPAPAPGAPGAANASGPVAAPAEAQSEVEVVQAELTGFLVSRDPKRVLEFKKMLEEKLPGVITPYLSQLPPSGRIEKVIWTHKMEGRNRIQIPAVKPPVIGERPSSAKVEKGPKKAITETVTFEEEEEEVITFTARFLYLPTAWAPKEAPKKIEPKAGAKKPAAKAGAAPEGDGKPAAAKDAARKED